MGKAENIIQKGITEWLEWHGWDVYRINNAGTYNKKREQYIFHGTAGISDLIAFRANMPVLFVECKSKKGKPSPSQIKFLETANNTKHAIGICTNDLDDFVAEIKKNLK